MIGIASKATTYALCAALLASLAWGGWQWRGKVSARTDTANARTAQAEAEKALVTREGEIAGERELFERQARAQEQRHAADMNRIERETRDRLEEAGNAAYNRAVADVRAGRLRGPWSCLSAPSVPGAGGPAAERDGAADDGGAATGRVLRIGARADERLRACQAVIRADRKPMDRP